MRSSCALHGWRSFASILPAATFESDEVSQLPWGYIAGSDDPTEPGFKPIEPEPICAEMGDHLARFVEGEFAVTGRDTRCETCAFRRGTLANTSLTIANALKATFEGDPFYCHETERPCGGWVALTKATPAPPPCMVEAGGEDGRIAAVLRQTEEDEENRF